MGAVPHTAHFSAVFREREHESVSLAGDFRNGRPLIAVNEVSCGPAAGEIQLHSNRQGFTAGQLHRSIPYALLRNWMAAAAGKSDEEKEDEKAAVFHCCNCIGGL